MTVRLEAMRDGIRIVDGEGKIPPAARTTLRLRGFSRIEGGLEARSAEPEDLVVLSLDLLMGAGVQVKLDEAARAIMRRREDARSRLEENMRRGLRIKETKFDQTEIGEFLKFLTDRLKRRLLPHQIKAAFHLISLGDSANFSVPGAGKTAVVLAAYEYQRFKGIVTSLFVVGPRSCFMPWRTEFELTLGRPPRFEILAGGDVGERRRKYFPAMGTEAELYLTTYQTLSRDKEKAQHLLQNRTIQAFFVIDEAHYMEQDEGVWASAVAETSAHARRRCILTGTPFPKNYADGLNQFETLYPNSGIFSPATKHRIRNASTSGDHQIARTLLEPRIVGLYFRVRKSDLNLSKPVFIPPIQINMNPIERELYDCIEKRIGELEEAANDWDLDTIIRLRMGRQIRRRQATSYAALLHTAINGYSETLIGSEDQQLNEKIRNYDRLETPAKMQRLIAEVGKLCRQHEKVVIWANFVGTLHKIKKECDRANIESRIVFGGTPIEDGMDDESREKIIETFKDSGSRMDILIANPAACAESVSLHKTCSNAIYYDLSYNCAEYLQSLDRIHRVGGSEDKVSYYRFLQYSDTFEHEILENLEEKTKRMAAVIDRDFPLATCELTELGIDKDGFIG